MDKPSYVRELWREFKYDAHCHAVTLILLSAYLVLFILGFYLPASIAWYLKVVGIIGLVLGYFSIQHLFQLALGSYHRKMAAWEHNKKTL